MLFEKAVEIAFFKLQLNIMLFVFKINFFIFLDWFNIQILKIIF